MGVQLPSEPITRKEQYLAKAAGQDVEIPSEPITREEAYLNAIAKGGGGTDDYNELENLPQIGGNTLTGNKSASDLGLASEDDLAGKQGTLTAKDYISIVDDKISVDRELHPVTYSYKIEYISREVLRVSKYVDSELESQTDYYWSPSFTPVTFDGFFTLYGYNDYSVGYAWKYELLKDSHSHSAGYTYVWNSWTGQVNITETFDSVDVSGQKLVIKSEMDAALAELADKLPTAPTTDGTYVLTVTVADGTPTYSWESGS